MRILTCPFVSSTRCFLRLCSCVHLIARSVYWARAVRMPYFATQNNTILVMKVLWVIRGRGKMMSAARRCARDTRNWVRVIVCALFIFVCDYIIQSPWHTRAHVVLQGGNNNNKTANHVCKCTNNWKPVENVCVGPQGEAIGRIIACLRPSPSGHHFKAHQLLREHNVMDWQ